MIQRKKNQKEILSKLKIEALNEMQESARLAIHSSSEVIVLSPTGSGKTLAFLLPLIGELDESINNVQLLIITPTRELATQIEHVVREMGTGFKVNAVYGGKSFSRDKMEMQHPPAILIGTPGRVNHHLRKQTFDTAYIKSIVLDEFDKSLEIGFEEEMTEIMGNLPFIEKKVLTSATNLEDLPAFVEITNPIKIDFLSDSNSRLKLKSIVSPDKDKLETLFKAICNFGESSGIIFCNYKDSIQRISSFLKDKGISHGCFYGGMEQIDRERTLVQFRNGSIRIIIATDLAARGLDIDELHYIMHYHLPGKSEEFIHRNGRTARMDKEGTAYILHWENEDLPDYLPSIDELTLEDKPIPKQTEWTTLFISGGRKDKISKGDIAGLFMKQAKVNAKDIGIIELSQDCSFVAIKKSQAKQAIDKLNNTKLKSKKVRIYNMS